MSRKIARYSTELKTKVVLEVLKEEKTLNEIASEHGINPANLKNWKKIFLENASIAMEPAKAVKEYKEENVKLQAKLDEYAKTVGRLTVEKEWAVGKLKSLDLSSKKLLIDKSEHKILSVSTQCSLIEYNRSNLFYIPMVNSTKKPIKDEIINIFEKIPCYGYMKVHQELLERGHTVCVNTVRSYRQELGLRAYSSSKGTKDQLG